MRCDVMSEISYDKVMKESNSALNCTALYSTLLYLCHFDRFEPLERVGGVLDGHVERSPLRHHLSVKQRRAEQCSGGQGGAVQGIEGVRVKLKGILRAKVIMTGTGREKEKVVKRWIDAVTWTLAPSSPLLSSALALPYVIVVRRLTSLTFLGCTFTATATPKSLMPMKSTSSHCCSPSLHRHGHTDTTQGSDQRYER
jgi:hypothetical protein